MPEGPELHLAARFVNAVCAGRVFSGRPVKSEVNWKNPEVPFEAKTYTISAASRGKEVQMSLNPIEDDKSKKRGGGKAIEALKIVFRFGMSGMFRFTSVSEVPKHAHLMFYTADKPPMVLSFVDVRRFGRWEVGGGWQKDRGPCIILEYDEFRAHVLSNMSDAAFNRPICEVLLNQKFFNGVGNYLRAEVLYRLGIPPFVSARSVLEPLAKAEELGAQNGMKGVKVKTEQPDLLELCNKLAKEVVSLGATTYNHTPDSESNHDAFLRWLQCYYNPDMRTLVDHNGRTIWFKGEAGPLAPKGGKSRGTNKKMEAAVQKRKSPQTDLPVKKVKGEVKTEDSKGSKAKNTPKRNTRAKTVGSSSTDSAKVGRTRRKAAPAPAKSTPARTKSTPARTKSTPARTKSTPARTKSTPARTKSTPARTKSTPARTKSTPARTKRTPKAKTPRQPVPKKTTKGRGRQKCSQ